MEMNEESILAWNIIEKTSANLFLTGKAGTGKTTFLKQLKEKSPKRMVVLAPTGIAAINAGGVTIHSFFQLPLSPYLPGTSFGGNEKKKYQFSALKRKIIRSIDLLVIDEISMVRSDLLDAIDSVLRRYRKHDLPFGGVQLLMIGDLHQLAPVVTDHEEGMLRQYYDTPYFFSSKALQQAHYLTIELKKVYRQQDQEFISLSSIRCVKTRPRLLRCRRSTGDISLISFLRKRTTISVSLPIMRLPRVSTRRNWKRYLRKHTRLQQKWKITSQSLHTQLITSSC